jgi:hypothetical protein
MSNFAMIDTTQHGHIVAIKEVHMSNFAVIDTETNWDDRVMSIGFVIADGNTFHPILSKYYILTPEKLVGGMFSDTLYVDTVKVDFEGSRREALLDMKRCLAETNTAKLFAYNASFDYRHLPELSTFAWYDIMRLAAYRQHNHKIPPYADCYGTGRLKRDYGVEPILRMLSGKTSYFEQHNALTDAFDELQIMVLLNHKLEKYVKL